MSHDSSATLALSNADDLVLTELAQVSRRRSLIPLEARLLRLKLWLKEDLRDLDRALGAVVSADDDLALRAASHMLGVPGKRLRPLCVVISARLGGRELDDDVTALAIAAELVHAATLLHDDVLDEGTERRGVPAARVVYGNSVSILAGDHLLVEALRRVHGAGHPELMTTLLDAVSEMVAAEARQLERRGRFLPDRRTYLDVIRGKTAALFRWCLHAGGSLGGLPPDSLSALASAGLSLGLAFQLVDDVLDLEGDAEQIGKEPFADLREGKLTWPVILACERDPELLTAMRAFVEAPESAPLGAAQLAARVRATGATGDTRAFAATQADQALSRLDALPAGRARRALELVLEAATSRAR